MNKQLLEKAAASGLISPEQILPLYQFISHETALAQSKGEEQLRFIRSFGDVFISLGIAFVAVSMALLQFTGIWLAVPILALCLTAEWLVRLRRLALPGIVILIALLFFVAQLWGFSDSSRYLLNAVNVTLAAAAFYWRYKMPFSMLAIALGILCLCSSVLGFEEWLLAPYGLTVFLVAMVFDARDTSRSGLASDCAFWLHLLAAPLMVHGMMVGFRASEYSLANPVLMLVFFIVFFLVALWVDRRALLVSSLSYAIYALITLAKQQSLMIENISLFIFMGFGAFIVFFGTYWYKARYIIFSRVASWSINRFVPAINAEK